MGGEGDDGAECGGENLHLRAELRTGLVGDERSDGDADDGVEEIPDDVEPGDLVGEELDSEEDR